MPAAYSVQVAAGMYRYEDACKHLTKPQVREMLPKGQQIGSIISSAGGKTFRDRVQRQVLQTWHRSRGRAVVLAALKEAERIIKEQHPKKNAAPAKVLMYQALTAELQGD